MDLTGQKFNKLRVIKRVDNNKHGQVMWLCKCECGNETVICGWCLKNGHTKSCGCLRKENLKRFHKQNTLTTGVASMRNVISSYKQKAYNYALTEKQFEEITQQPCYYCGAKPNNMANRKGCNGRYIYNGLDRVDNTKGYTVDNVVPCCKNCNIAKNTRTLQEFKDWIDQIYHYLNKGGELCKNLKPLSIE